MYYIVDYLCFKKSRREELRKRDKDWKYNNIQPVTRPDGSVLEGMLLFYGWKDKNAPEAKAFLLHEE